jgi:hypothetical protein
MVRWLDAAGIAVGVQLRLCVVDLAGDPLIRGTASGYPFLVEEAFRDFEVGRGAGWSVAAWFVRGHSHLLSDARRRQVTESKIVLWVIFGAAFYPRIPV